MKKNVFYTYLTVCLAMLIPFPGRLAYGVLMIILLNLLMFAGTVVGKLSTAIEMEEMHVVIVSITLLSLSMLFRQVLVIYSPLLALSMGFLVYIPAFSSFMIGSLYSVSKEKLNVDLKQNMKQSGLFSVTALLFFLFRDIFGYGTITLPVPDGLFVVELFNANKNLLMGNIWASIPGALVLASLILILSIHIKKKFEIVRTLNAGYSTAVESVESSAASVSVSGSGNVNPVDSSTANATSQTAAVSESSVNPSSNGGNVNA